jgi:hypothetical protein
MSSRSLSCSAWRVPEPQNASSLDQLRRFHYLYERASSDLGKITTFASEPDTRRYLETLGGAGLRGDS